MKKITIVIVSFNGGENLVNLITSLNREAADFKGIEAGTVLVDNNSSDGVIERLEDRKQELGLKIIRNDKNLGFAKGCNIGIKYALKNKADAVLLINQDVSLEKTFIEALANNSSDIAAPVIKFQRDKKWIYDFGGRINWWWGRVRHIEKFSILNSQFSKIKKEIDYVSGCCMLVKRQVFEKIGLFDERFFLYFEDADFCIRAKKAGFAMAVEPKSVIMHKLSEGKDRLPTKRRNLILSNLLFINKYLGWKIVFGYIYIFLLWIKIRICYKTSFSEGPDEKI